MGVPEQAPANAEHHRPVPPHQRLEGFLVVPGDEPGQELSIAIAPCLLSPVQAVDMSYQKSELCVRHGPALRKALHLSLYWRPTPREMELSRDFFCQGARTGPRLVIADARRPFGKADLAVSTWGLS